MGAEIFPPPRVFLPVLHIPVNASFVSLYADVQPVYGGGGTQIRSVQRRLAGHKANLPLSPLGRKRI